MLKIGAQDITGLYIGEAKIGKAYIGENLVFSAAKKPSRLPEGYTELEYVSTNGKQIILTDISPTVNTEIDADISVDYSSSNTTMRLLYSSVYTGSIYYHFVFQFKCTSSRNYGSANMGKNKGVEVEICNIETYKKFHITYNTAKKFASIDGEAIQFSSNEVYSKPKEFKLFGAGFSTSTQNVTNAFWGKIYNFILKQNGEEKLNFIPCTNAEGVAGLYNLVDGSFIEPEGTAQFIPGPAV